MFLVALLAACTPGSGPGQHRHPGSDAPTGTGATGDTASATTGATGDTGTRATGDTGNGGVVADCSLLVPAASLSYTHTPTIVTEEDFDFDAQGWILTQRGTDLQGIDRFGVSHFVAANIGLDAAGIRSTASGDIIVAQPDTGSVRRVDPTTGGSIIVLSGLGNPNGVEAGEDGMVYVAENSLDGRIRMFDPLTGAVGFMMPSPYTNGLVLSPDEQTLYVASSASTFNGPTSIGAISRDGAGDWDPNTLQVLHVDPDYIGSLTVDACGNLYALGYSTGKLFRIDPVTLAIEPMLNFTQFGSFSALHFSPGFGGWAVDSLFVTSRNELFEVPVGVPGSHVLMP